MANSPHQIQQTGGLLSCICWFWSRILDLALILWVTRVPLTITAVGYLILTVAPQAQDLFVELASILAIAPQADDPFVELARAYGRVLLFLALLFFIWAMPTHYSARLLLDTDGRFQAFAPARPDAAATAFLRAIECWTPRVLGLATFVAVLIALWRSYANLPILDEPEVTAAIGAHLLNIGELVVVAAALFFGYTIKRPREADSFGLGYLKSLNRTLEPIWRHISPTGAKATNPQTEESRNVGRFLLVVVFAVFVSIFTFGADWAAEQFPRGLAVPIILGGWLPFLCYLSALGRRLRAPLIFAVWALTVGLTAAIGDNHSVRRINAAKVAGHPVDVARMRLDYAVSLWMQENGCSNLPATCPRPILVAAAGGASRAAFFTASIVGHFLQDAEKHNLDPNDVRRRLFAISGVSGGSVGAVMLTAALDSKSDTNHHLCAETKLDLWWGKQIGNWRDCFEALTSGDFLTSDFIGFAFRDMASFMWWRDRAALLEDAMTRRYRSVVTRADVQGPLSCFGLECPFQLLRPRAGHWIPLLALHGTSEATGKRLITSVLSPQYAPRSPDLCPTSYRAQGKDTGCVLFAETSHFHDLLNDGLPPSGKIARLQTKLLADDWDKTPLDDIRLSTAAHNSARFPLISPPGSVRNRTNGIADRVVDGGYFENYGAIGAMEIALAIQAVQPALAPFVMVISNDPGDLIDPADESDGPAAEAKTMLERSKRAKVDGSELLTDVTTTIKTFVNTRDARGILGVAQLRGALRRAMPRCDDHVTHIRVWPQPLNDKSGSRAVSMSWWVSTPIQRHLHQQTEGTTNQNQNGPRLEAVWRALGSNSVCAAPAGQK